MKLATIILAAGKGTRMESDLPKVLHRLNNRTLIERVVDTSKKLNSSKIIIVIGYKKELVKDGLKEYNDIEYAIQSEQKGTGHAVKMCFDNLKDFIGDVLILSGDVPLISLETLQSLIDIKQQSKTKAAILTATMQDPSGYGRVIREKEFLNNIVEHKDCNQHELKVNEINAGIYLVNSKFLIKYIPEIGNQNNQKEYYLPDIFNLMIADKYKVAIHKISNTNEISGINNKEQLEELNNYLITHEKSKED